MNPEPSVSSKPSNKIKRLRDRLNSSVASLSLTGKLVLAALIVLFAGSSLYMLYEIDASFLVTIPVSGGSIRIGETGEPQFINPILATTDADNDLAALVYSGLMRRQPDGSLIPDLAQSYTISPDGKTYTFSLKTNATFQDGRPVTADDVVFTINMIQNPAIQSPDFANWAGVQVKKIDQNTVQFILPSPYGAFLQNTTIGILPQHLWVGVDSNKFAFAPLNGNPIGSGPYQISSIQKDSNGVPISYTLIPFEHFTLGKPYISQVKFIFYKDDAGLISGYNAGEIDSLDGISPEDVAGVKAGTAFAALPLPRTFALFFNQAANPVLADATVRQALDMTVNRDYIVNTVLQGFANPLYGPVPNAFLNNASDTETGTTTSIDERIAAANALLDKDGWTKDATGIREKTLVSKDGKKTETPLSFSISTTDAPELKEVADTLSEEWRQIGVDVTVKVFEGGYLDQNVIKPRDYDSLLFGEVVNTDYDLYPFWDSSQSNDPGLNIAMYSNKSADALLSQMRATTSPAAEEADYSKFQTDIAKDIPAVFLYSPDLIYIEPRNTGGIETGTVISQSDRFSGIYEWYTQTDRVWKIFLHTGQ